jgi:O-antigen/teichoic acid export membrane protein
MPALSLAAPRAPAAPVLSWAGSWGELVECDLTRLGCECSLDYAERAYDALGLPMRATDADNRLTSASGPSLYEIGNVTIARDGVGSSDTSWPTETEAAVNMTRRALVSTFGVTGMMMALSLVTSIVLARNLGPEGRGLLLALTFWPALWTALSNLSLNEAICVHVARSGAADGGAAQRNFESSGLVLQLIMSVVTAAVSMALIAAMLPENRRDSLTIVLWYTAAFASLSTLDQHFKAVLQGRGAFGRLNVARLSQPLIYMLALFGLISSRSMSVEHVMAAVIAGLAGSTVIATSIAGVKARGASLANVKLTLSSGLRFHVANVLLYGAAEVDKLLVLQLLDDKNIGFYAVAIAVSALGSGLVVQSLGLILTRQMAAATRQDERAEMMVHYLHDAALLMVVVNGAAAALAPFWVPALFGVGFAPAVPTVIILLLMGTLRGLRQIVDRAMRAARTTSVGIIGEGVALVATVACATLGGRAAGIEGLAGGLVIAQALALVVMMFMTVKALDIAPTRLSPFHVVNLARLRRLARREVELARAFWR